MADGTGTGTGDDRGKMALLNKGQNSAGMLSGGFCQGSSVIRVGIALVTVVIIGCSQ